MKNVTRRFIADTSSVYFVSNGCVLRQDISDFMKDNKSWLWDLIGSGENVGWCTPDTVLMVFDNKISRVSQQMFDRMFRDEFTEHHSIDVMDFEVSYDADKYTDIYLCASDNYKNDKLVSIVDCSVIRTTLHSDTPHSRNRILAMSNDCVYTVYNNMIEMMPLRYYIASHGSSWQSCINRMGDKSAVCHEGTALLISSHKIWRIRKTKAIELIADKYSRVQEFGSSQLCFNVEYNIDKYTNVYLGVNSVN